MVGQLSGKELFQSRVRYLGWPWVEPFHVDPALIEARRERLNRAMHERAVDALLLMKAENIRFVTDFPTKGYRPFLELEYACVLPRDGSPLLGYSSGADEARLDRYGTVERSTKLGPEEGWSEQIAQLVADAGAAEGTIGTDLLPFDLAGHLRERLPGLTLLPFGDEWARITAVKLPQEIAILRHAVKIAEQGMAAAVAAATQGTTEIAVSARAEQAMRAAGSEVSPFIPMVASGANASFSERMATHKPLAPGELVIFDLGCVYRGYTAEYARTICLGEPTTAQRRAWEAVDAASRTAIAALRPGTPCAEVDRVARRALVEAGYGRYQHKWATGHQIGFGLHGAPAIASTSKAVIEAGMVVNLEPGVYLDDQPAVGGVCIEESVLVTPDGPEVLTTAPRGLVWP